MGARREAVNREASGSPPSVRVEFGDFQGDLLPEEVAAAVGFGRYGALVNLVALGPVAAVAEYGFKDAAYITSAARLRAPGRDLTGQTIIADGGGVFP